MKLNTESITEKSRYWDAICDLAKNAFPPEEYLAPDELVEMANAEDFDFLALTDEGQFVGFMAVQIYESLVYLFFLAIDPSCRSKGYGSEAIKALKARYPDKKQTVDFEMLDEEADNNEQRIKRKSFYLRNGYKETGLFLSYFGVDYEVMCMDSDFDEEQFKGLMRSVRVKDFDPVYFHG